MSAYSYCSKSQYPQRAAKRMIGFQIFCYRHKYKLSTEVFCKRCGISPKELEKVELGLPSQGGAALAFHTQNFRKQQFAASYRASAQRGIAKKKRFRRNLFFQI